MAAIGVININLNEIPEDKIYNGKKGRYLSVKINIKDDVKYGNNISASVNQSKDEQENKEPVTYLGNGKIVWTDGEINTAKSLEESSEDAEY